MSTNEKTPNKYVRKAKRAGGAGAWMREHEQHDNERFQILGDKLDELKGLLTYDADIPELEIKKGDLKFATKADVAPVIKIYKNVLLAGRITEGGSKWFYRAVLTLSAFFIAWGVLLGGFKAAAAGAIAWITNAK